MSKRQTLEELYNDRELLFADGLDDAIIGIDSQSGRIVYSVMKVLEVLRLRDHMDMETAREFFDFNIGGAWVGELTPIWCEDMEVWSW